MNKLKHLFSGIFLFAGIVFTNAQKLPSGFINQRLGRLNFPVNMTFLPDGRILVGEQQGFVKVFKNGAFLAGNALTLDSVYSQNEKGLLGLAVDPNFTSTGHVYFYYTANQAGNYYQGTLMPGTPVLYKIVRYTMSGDIFLPASKVTVIDLEMTPGFIVGVNHDGGQLLIGPDMKLYVAIGDAELWCSSSCMNLLSTNCNCGPTWIPPTWSDEMNTYLGKILRINMDGTAPSDNPYFTTPTPVTKQQKYFVAKGMRNPFTMTFKGNTNQLLVGDVGSSPPAQREEINLVTVPGAQKHLGFPHGEGILNNPLYYDPIYAYGGGGSSTSTGCAIVGATYFSPLSTNWPTQYRNKYYYMDLCNGYINTMDIDNGNQRANFATNMVTNFNNAVSGDGNIGLASGVDGNMYYLTRSGTASIVGLYRISYQPVSISGVNISTTSNIISVCGTNLQLSALISPANATYQSIIWSTNPSTFASVSSNGLVTPLTNGVVTISARSVGNYALVANSIITISGQSSAIPQITVSGLGGTSSVGINNTLQMNANVFPLCQGSDVNWSVINGSGTGNINSSGILTGTGVGTITVRATLVSNPTITGTLLVTVTSTCATSISGFTISVSGSANISSDKGTLQLLGIIAPANACTSTLGWTVTSNSACASASISGVGLLKSLGGNGSVTVSGIPTGNTVLGRTLVITISGQIVSASGVTINNNSAGVISVSGGTLSITGLITPSCATNQNIRFSLINGSGSAVLNTVTGVLSATGNGLVSVVGTSVSNPSVKTVLVVTISGQCSPTISALNILSQGNVTLVLPGSTAQLYGIPTPSIICNTLVSYVVTATSGMATATVSGSGLVNTGAGNGVVTIIGISQMNNAVRGLFVLSVNSGFVPVSSISITTIGANYQITSPNGVLQIGAIVLPLNATNPSVSWSIITISGNASVNSSGLVTAISNGVVTVKATSNSNTSVSGVKNITISGQCSSVVSSVTITASGTTISSQRGTLQLSALLSPSIICSPGVTWSVLGNNCTTASISGTGLLQATGTNGVVTVVSTAISNPVYGKYIVTISGQNISVSSFSITNSSPIINTQGGTLQMTYAIAPICASNQIINWSVITSTGSCAAGSISNSGLLQSTFGNGILTVLGTSASNGSLVSRSIVSISGQTVGVSSVQITNNVLVISTVNGTIQMAASAFPICANNQNLTWSMNTISGNATLNSLTGILTAISNGVVSITVTANDNSSISNTVQVTITGQCEQPQSLTITTLGNAFVINSDKGTLTLGTSFSPAFICNSNVNWSVVSATGCATGSITGNGLFSSNYGNGTITLKAVSQADLAVFGMITVTVTNQVVNVTRVNIYPQNATISVKNGTLLYSLQILPQCVDNQIVKWYLLNGNGIATINSLTGVVTAENDGEVIVVAQSIQSSNILGTATLSIIGQNVIPPTIPVNAIIVTFAGGNGMITELNGTLQFSSLIKPINASVPDVIWSVLTVSGNATIDSNTGLLKALGNGKVIVFATSVSNSAVTGSYVLSISGQPILPIKNTTEINQSAEMRGITIYPNPNNGSFMMVAEQVKGAVDIVVINNEGKEMYLEHVTNFSGSHVLNLSHLPKSVYKVSIITETGVYHRIVVIQ
jgi:glucose/arabinose dehydrogenase